MTATNRARYVLGETASRSVRVGREWPDVVNYKKTHLRTNTLSEVTGRVLNDRSSFVRAPCVVRFGYTFISRGPQPLRGSRQARSLILGSLVIWPASFSS